MMFEPEASKNMEGLFKCGKMDNKTKYSSDGYDNMAHSNPIRDHYASSNRTWRRQSASDLKTA